MNRDEEAVADWLRGAGHAVSNEVSQVIDLTEACT